MKIHFKFLVNICYWNHCNYSNVLEVKVQIGFKFKYFDQTLSSFDSIKVLIITFNGPNFIYWFFSKNLFVIIYTKPFIFSKTCLPDGPIFTKNYMINKMNILCKCIYFNQMQNLYSLYNYNKYLFGAYWQMYHYYSF